MSKYNLTDIFEEMSSGERESFDRLSKEDQIKLEKIMAMMAKEKSMKEDKYDDIVDADDDIPADKKKEAAAAYRKVDKGASYEKATSHIKEVSSRVGSRIEGLLSIPLKQQFLDSGKELIQDLLQEDPFDITDVIEHLAIELEKYVSDLPFDVVAETRPGYKEDGTPKSNDEMDDDEREDFYNDSAFIDEDETLKEHFGRFMKDYQ